MVEGRPLNTPARPVPRAPRVPPLVKICCISSIDEARLAVRAGAAVLGLVSHMPSGPGVISDHLAAQIVAAVGASAETFLLTSRTTAQGIAEQHREVRSSALQLVDHVPLDELRQLRALCPGVKLVQVIHVLGDTHGDAASRALSDASVAEAVAAAPCVDAILLDSGNPLLAVKELGGTGRVHNWGTSARIRAALQQLPERKPLFLAGGLRPHNVEQAITTVEPDGLDVCSGVRRAGQLDEALLHAFVAAANVSPGLG